MTDPLGGRLGDGQPRFRRWIDAARAVRTDGGVGWRGYWRGFVPCFLRYVFLIAFFVLLASCCFGAWLGVEGKHQRPRSWCIDTQLTRTVLQGVSGKCDGLAGLRGCHASAASMMRSSSQAFDGIATPGIDIESTLNY